MADPYREVDASSTRLITRSDSLRSADTSGGASDSRHHRADVEPPKSDRGRDRQPAAWPGALALG
jgi:hypothetical protein